MARRKRTSRRLCTCTEEQGHAAVSAQLCHSHIAPSASAQPQRSPQTACSSIPHLPPSTPDKVFISQSKQGLGASEAGPMEHSSLHFPALGAGLILLHAQAMGAKFRMVNGERAGSRCQEPRWGWRFSKLVQLVRTEPCSAGIARNSSTFCSSVPEFFSNHQTIP